MQILRLIVSYIRKLMKTESNYDDTFQNVCRYLNDVLQFRDYIKVPDISDSIVRITKDEFTSGILFPETMNALNKWIPVRGKKQNEKIDKDNINGQKTDEKDKNDDKKTDESINVIIIPKILNDILQKQKCKKGYKGENWEYEKIGLLYIKAKYSKNSGLKCLDGESLVWADPLIIDNESKKANVSIGIKGVAFELSNAVTPLNSENGWEKYIGTVKTVYKERTGTELICDGYTADYLVDTNGKVHKFSDEIVIMKDPTVFAEINIVKMLDDIMKTDNKELKLLRTMICGVKTKSVHNYILGTNVASHYGQMKPDFPLADAQRTVVHCFGKLQDGEVLAVSGPPGTGKTTVLQSIVAQMIVDKTLNVINSRHEKGKGMMSSPLILASSTNNKAITNIVDAFNIDDKLISINPLYGRWLYYENAKSNEQCMLPLAVYLPANPKDSNSEYFRTDFWGGVDYAKVKEHYTQCPNDFLNVASKVFGTYDLKEIRESLFKELKSTEKDLKKINRLLEKKEDCDNTTYKVIQDIIKKYSLDNEQTEKLIEQGKLANAECIDKYLDQTLRHHMFWLAVHYNECAWISMIQNKSSQTQKKPICGKFLFDELRFVCPCMVATLYKAPGIFSYIKKDKKQHYNYNEADLLIIDEAGQVSPDKGLPTFALAKKAVVVGDTKQIPPVSSITEEIDDKFAKQTKLDKDTHSLMSCQYSSLMSVAEARSRFDRKGTDGKVAHGLFLDEHRRCVDEIIEYSNELLYNQALTPMRGPAKKNCKLTTLPAMSIVDINGTSLMSNGSRYNNDEIYRMREWIEDNERTILDAYGKTDIRDLICIITPFSEQVNRIKADKYLNKYSSGTVHTFQGAEKPIVLFSMVYGADDSPWFIKSNHELMNVAVSRAKDHFVVFGSRTCLSNNKADKACYLLFEKTEPCPSKIDNTQTQ